MRTFTNLYSQLLKAHKRGLIRLYTTHNHNQFDKFCIAFADSVTTKARDTLHNHIKQTYNVQIWWHDKNVLYVQELSKPL